MTNGAYCNGAADEERRGGRKERNDAGSPNPTSARLELMASFAAAAATAAPCKPPPLLLPFVVLHCSTFFTVSANFNETHGTRQFLRRAAHFISGPS